MIGIFIKKGKFGCRDRHALKEDGLETRKKAIYKPRNARGSLKLGGSPGTDSPFQPRGTSPAHALVFGLLGSKTVRQ